MAGFLTDADLQTRFELVHKGDQFHALQDWWLPHIPDCNAQAWSFIAATMQQSRGYTLAQVLLWGAAGKGVQTEIALWLLNARGRLDTGLPPGENEKDPRAMLTAVDESGDYLLWITDDEGNLIEPAGEARVLFGRVNEVPADVGSTFLSGGKWKDW